MIIERSSICLDQSTAIRKHSWTTLLSKFSLLQKLEMITADGLLTCVCQKSIGSVGSKSEQQESWQQTLVSCQIIFGFFLFAFEPRQRTGAFGGVLFTSCYLTCKHRFQQPVVNDQLRFSFAVEFRCRVSLLRMPSWIRRNSSFSDFCCSPPSADESNSFQLIVIEILNLKCALAWIIYCLACCGLVQHSDLVKLLTETSGRKFSPKIFFLRILSYKRYTLCVQGGQEPRTCIRLQSELLSP